MTMDPFRGTIISSSSRRSVILGTLMLPFVVCVVVVEGEGSSGLRVNGLVMRWSIRVPIISIRIFNGRQRRLEPSRDTPVRNRRHPFDLPTRRDERWNLVTLFTIVDTRSPTADGRPGRHNRRPTSLTAVSTARQTNTSPPTNRSNRRCTSFHDHSWHQSFGPESSAPIDRENQPTRLLSPTKSSTMVDHGKSTKRKKFHDKDKYYRRKLIFSAGKISGLVG
jgi:hypothetical protein